MNSDDEPGVHLVRTAENADEIAALAKVLGGSVGIGAVLGDLNRRGRRAAPWGRAVASAFTFDRGDRSSPRWFPQGVTTSADANHSERVEGRRVVAVAWYYKGSDGKNQGSRVTVFDLDTRRYRHVLLVRPVLRDGHVTMTPLKVHAGGIVWHGDYLHVAATAKGFVTCRLDDVLRIPERRSDRDQSRLGISPDAPDKVASFGYRYVLPVRFAYRSQTQEGREQLKYSFLSLDRQADPPAIMAGEYARGKRATRLARYHLDPVTDLLRSDDDDVSHPVHLDPGGVEGMQGVAVVGDDYYVTVSHGPWTPGSVFVGQPGALRQHRFATPIGPEDISYWPSTDRFWSVTEHPRRRWIYSMKRSRLR